MMISCARSTWVPHPCAFARVGNVVVEYEEPTIIRRRKRVFAQNTGVNALFQESIHSDTIKGLEYIASVVRVRCVAVPSGRPKSKARILARLASATFGNFGDCEPVGEGVSEMRIHVGAGYRVYYTRTGSTVYVLLAGGVKASQTKDIAKAKKMTRELKRANQ